MNLDKPDYSIYTYYDVWTLRDAFNIIVRECEHRVGLHDKHGFIESVTSGRKYEVLNYLQDQHRIYIDEVVLSKRYYLLSKRLEAKGESYNILRYMDLDKNQVDVKRFIKFAVSNELPFPQELVDAFIKKDVPGNAQFNPTRIIDAAINAVIFCLDNEVAREVTADEVISYLELKGFSDINEATKQEIYALIPKAIRVAAIPLDVKDKRRYGILKNEKANQQYVIRATVEATRHMSELPPGTEMSAAEMYDWLYSNGFKDLTKRMYEQIWQALPSAQKKSAGPPMKKVPKK